MRKLKPLFRECRSFLLFLGLLMVFRTTYADWSPVPTSSMEPTILPGDVVWIDKTAYGPSLPFLNKRLLAWGQPARGDIITFVPPHVDDLYVKRVMAIPGDTIRIEGNDVYINGVHLEQTLTVADRQELVGVETIDGRQHAFKLDAGRDLPWFGQTLVVPAGKLFAMGDFRNNSADSRFWGFVDESQVTGRVSAIAVSFSSERDGSRIALPIQ
jgi:signal peptidase I